MDISEKDTTIPSDLVSMWKSIDGEQKVIAFYSNNANYYPCFSNFWKHELFDFVIPEWCGEFAGTSVPVEFSEKAIMLCKASLFHDLKIFNQIIKADTPMKTKKLGRKCKFDQKIWNNYVCSIAKYVVYQKILSVPGLKQILLDTGDEIIAEAAPRDRIWGIGLEKNNTNCNFPSKWKGCNILGWALMEARDNF